jgi:rhodanese-related sulfurtransferase
MTMSATIRSVPASEVHAARVRGESPAIADVRTPAEFAAVHAVGAINHPLDGLDPATTVESFGIAGLGREVPLYLTCLAGQRAALAADRLAAAGYPNVALLEGGTRAWEAEKLPVVRGRTAPVLSLPQQVQVTIGALLLLKTVLGTAVHPVFFILTGAIGAGLIYAGLTENCLLARVLGRMPWNRIQAAERA